MVVLKSVRIYNLPKSLKLGECDPTEQIPSSMGSNREDRTINVISQTNRIYLRPFSLNYKGLINVYVSEVKLTV